MTAPAHPEQPTDCTWPQSGFCPNAECREHGCRKVQSGEIGGKDDPLMAPEQPKESAPQQELPAVDSASPNEVTSNGYARQAPEPTSAGARSDSTNVPRIGDSAKYPAGGADPSQPSAALAVAARQAIDCICDLGAGKGGWDWEGVANELEEALRAQPPVEGPVYQQWDGRTYQRLDSTSTATPPGMEVVASADYKTGKPPRSEQPHNLEQERRALSTARMYEYAADGFQMNEDSENLRSLAREYLSLRARLSGETKA